MLQGVLFDMDGVLFDTERMAAQIEQEILQEMGHTLPPDFYTRICGSNATQVRYEFLQVLGQNFAYDDFVQQLNNAMADKIARDGMPKMPGVDETLQYLQQQGYKMAVASSSNNDTIRRFIEAADIAHYFSAVVSGDMIQNSKPAPDIFLAAAAAIGLPSNQCLAVEDSINGVRSAIAAGCVTVMVPDMLPPTPDIEENAAAILPSLRQLPAFLQNYTRPQ